MSKILIVDDDIAIAELISDALEDEGFETKFSVMVKVHMLMCLITVVVFH